MATRSTGSANRSSSSRAPRPAATRRRRASFNFNISPDVRRWILALILQLIGVTFLIGLFVQGGSLTDLERNTLAPWFGTPRWLLPPLLIVLGYYLEKAHGESRDWQLTLLGSAVGFVSLLGIFGLVEGAWDGVRPSGGGIGHFIAANMTPLVTVPGTAIILAFLTAAGVLLALDMSIPAVAGPLGRLASGAMQRLFRPGTAPVEGASTATGSLPARAERPGKAAPIETRPVGPAARTVPSIPVAIPSTGPSSQTFAPPASPTFLRDGGPIRETPSVIAAAEAAARTGLFDRGAAAHEGGSIRDIGHARVPRTGAAAGRPGAGESSPTATIPPREYHLPPLALLGDSLPRTTETTMDHQRNAAIIEGKLLSLGILAKVVNWNAGPVLTQYEVAPSPEIKVSRIEALSDDLAMALAARAIRIEAPIPGKSVVGLEIPNKDFNIVPLRPILEEVDLRTSSKLVFALGREVDGRARAVDLGKMPHMLIAGATGSGKSVMVNALITSLLCNATPDDVRMILMDLKRVELAGYHDLPHLMVPVITEPERAKAALKWAVAEMENRYRRFAGANARNISGFNETRADPADKMPYLVIIIDELADLMMREGKNVEEPIVRLAQKARATGIHMVLATQRPSVNVVTGLIKANFPCRIAFAMASQIDSRTILDTPGAEDLMGRGDMLFQPADLPRPIRLQGVFVSDKEIAAITDYWRAEDEPHYDMGIIETDEVTETGEQEPDIEADRLLLDAVGVIQEYDRASASLLQRRLKIGYARAARIIDQLEERGYIGPFDGSNARPVLRRDAAPQGRSFGGGEDDE
jgi:DNA segregation ATPase FtsK/SpoIIIE-like protein